MEMEVYSTQFLKNNPYLRKCNLIRLKNKVKYLQIIGVDNVLVKILDPISIG